MAFYRLYMRLIAAIMLVGFSVSVAQAAAELCCDPVIEAVHEVDCEEAEPHQHEETDCCTSYLCAKCVGPYVSLPSYEVTVKTAQQHVMLTSGVLPPEREPITPERPPQLLG